MSVKTVHVMIDGFVVSSHLKTTHEIAQLLAETARELGRPSATDTRSDVTFTFPNGMSFNIDDASAADIRNAYRPAYDPDAMEVCGRCGGAGGWSGWPDFTCFRCHGAGTVRAAVNRAGERGQAEAAMSAMRADLRSAPEFTACACGSQIEDGARFCEDCTEYEIEAELADATRPAMVLDDGTYTLIYETDSYFTFRIRTVASGRLAGKRVAEYLNGPDNEVDFQAFAFVNTHTLNVWHRFERGPLVNRAREIEAMARQDRAGMEAAGLRYAERSSRCRRCNKVLTVAASLMSGYGPDCAAHLGVAYGSTTRRSDPTAEFTDNPNACPTCGGEGCDVCDETGIAQLTAA